ncbi:MAG: glutathione S-transferase N-terminal domain-containing protein [Gammaproteobacteria bacterium]|nr:glutathione S-transferase N-terminal domain-containing protein [Gammaproteobacteria bacterium]MBU0771392.1 glutathione S-transferase N-terminal domain-containing protein [Gammaproteobacteria bacterium]MBU0857092.1 glutathione S-transferase N-terminal domain-containing protein [Gammaproteobacteria bacterium]MBU1847970.1 glutathione S-transferase N-terminal domain-containing protein [Gammaproteobacteria bacterium]
MIDLHFWPTPNGYKVLMFLEETGIEHRIIPVNIGAGEQFRPEFLAISPNNRMPAIVDQAPADGGAPLSVFESGAILLYLGEKTGQFLPLEARARVQVLEWLFWQVGGLGPMAGQNHHFVQYAPEPIAYAIKRYVDETARLYGVLNKRLATHEFVGGDSYSIADMACYPWVVPHKRQQMDLESFPHLQRWQAQVAARAATRRAYERGVQVSDKPVVDEASKSLLFGQNADTVARQ